MRVFPDVDLLSMEYSNERSSLLNSERDVGSLSSLIPQGLARGHYGSFSSCQQVIQSIGCDTNRWWIFFPDNRWLNSSWDISNPYLKYSKYLTNCWIISQLIVCLRDVCQKFFHVFRKINEMRNTVFVHEPITVDPLNDSLLPDGFNASNYTTDLQDSKLFNFE